MGAFLARARRNVLLDCRRNSDLHYLCCRLSVLSWQEPQRADTGASASCACPLYHLLAFEQCNDSSRGPFAGASKDRSVRKLVVSHAFSRRDISGGHRGGVAALDL